MTRSQQKLVQAVERDGEAWIVPAQMRMARVLQMYALLRITDERRFDKSKNIYLRRVVRVSQEDKG